MSDQQLTARDIAGQSFKKKVRGYDPDEVQLFLRSVADCYERMVLSHATCARRSGG